MSLARAARVLACAALGACASVHAPDAPTREGFVDAGEGVRLFYRAFGAGRDTVVVVHGFQGNNQNYLAADLLPLARYRVVIFYDQRGDGRSSAVDDTARLGIESHVADLEALRRHFGLGRLKLLGHSGGAAIAMRYAIEHPDRVSRLVLVGPPPPVREPYPDSASRAFAARLDGATRARAALAASLPTADDPVAACRELAALVLPRAYLADSAHVRRMRADFCGSPPDRIRTQAGRLAAFQRTLPADWRAELRGVRIPVLVIHGERDAIPVASSAAWVAALPDARLLVLPRADHLPWLDRPHAFFATADRFLAGAWPRGSHSISPNP